MKIKEMYEILKKQIDIGNGDCKIEFYFKLDDGNEIDLKIEEIGQFNIIPDMTITFEKEEYEKKLLVQNELTDEQLEYKKRFEKVIKELDLEIEKMYKISQI